MGRYIIAIGGTGNKIMESIVYAACADAFYTVDADGRRRPIPELRMLSVDVDAACGNTTRAQRAAEVYEQVRASFAASPYRHRCFHTALSVDRWSMNLSRRAASVEQMARRTAGDRLLSRALFSPTEASLAYSEGFRGHPNLGVLFFSDLIAASERAQDQRDELGALIRRMQAEVEAGEAVQLMLCGSIFGGTGASGIPALSRYLRTRFAAHSERFVMGAMLMLPYYSVPAANVDERTEIAVRSDTFLDKARTALQYYGMNDMLRSGEDGDQGVFDAAYLLGLPPEHFVSMRVYATGSRAQENDAHLLEWMATRCVARFFRTSFRGEGARNMDCYIYQWHTPRLCWDSFDEDAELFRGRYGAMLKAAAVYASECYPTLRQYARSPRGPMRRVGYVSASFHGLGRGAAASGALTDRFDALYQFFAFYVNWLAQVTRSLPPGLRGGDAPQGEPPSNGLVDAALLGALMTLLSGDSSRAEQSRQRLQRGLAGMVCGRVPDRRGFERVMRGLGGCEGGARSVDAAFAGFVTALLASVMDAG